MKMKNNNDKVYKLNYTKADGTTKQHLILAPHKMFTEGRGGFVAWVFAKDGSHTDRVRRFNWHRVNSFEPLHKRPVLANGLSAVTV